MNGVICLSRDEKEKDAINVIRNALDKSDNPYVSFSGGKKSPALLDMAMRIISRKLNVQHVETGAEF
jgi:3'-phosphoadenosine 5'-phosphosulfate sulfotransferase (PAPS reductase)/FAD synthetase